MGSMLAGAILSVLVEVALTRPASWIAKALKSKKAKTELADIAAKAVNAAAEVFPDIREDLESETFIKYILLPTLETTLEDPSQVPDMDALSGRYIEVFIERFAKNDSNEAPSLLRVEKPALAPAFSVMLDRLRSGLNASEAWRERAHHLTSEMTLDEVQSLRAAIDRILPNELANLDLDAARQDARLGSSELRNWPRSIKGRTIVRPELKRLQDRIAVEPAATSLLIGEAGTGKSALLAELTSALEDAGKVVLAIKADTLPATVETIADLGRALGLKRSLEAEIAILANEAPIVVIIDQLDAVSRIMDRTSTRMRVLLQFVRRLRDYDIPAHVLVSSRPFEASHDARFQSLGAERFELRLPTLEQVDQLLADIGIDTASVDPAIRETLRRPFALKLFADLSERGYDVGSLTPSLLLDRWLETADLGDSSQRSSALRLLHALAAEMLATETLWRPADTFEGMDAEALARCEACGLVVRSEGRIGFSHQSWLDDFQAKGFLTGDELASYVWENQDSLFVRGTLLRALQRLRMRDDKAYIAAIDALLGGAHTRRHVLHLVTDIISSNARPLPREAAWLETFVRKDTVLAARGLGNVVEPWEHWRGSLTKLLPQIMKEKALQWRAIQLLAAEVKLDPDNVANLLERYWDDLTSDALAFSVLEKSGDLTASLEALLEKILRRTKVEDFAMSSYVSKLREDGRLTDAIKVVSLWANTAEANGDNAPRLFEVQKLADAAPLEFAETLLPWFVELASRQVADPRPGFRIFSRSESLPWDWNDDGSEDSLIGAVRSSVKTAAASGSNSFRELMERFADVEIDQVQELFAEALCAGAEQLSEAGFEFLMRDPRRLKAGDTHVEVEPGVHGSESGYWSQELIAAIAPCLTNAQLESLRDLIENWSTYGPETVNDENVQTRKARLRWAEQDRLALLDRLPSGVVGPRRRRQIDEWRAVRPRPRKAGIRTMAGWVGSPMSSEEMAKASEDAIMQMLDEINDTTPERMFRRPISKSGGVGQLSQAFAAFGKDHPDRALQIARTRLEVEKHEHAAGYLIDELSKEDSVSANTVLSVIQDLSAKGFRSQTWTLHASWSLERLAPRLNGLDDATVALIASWLQNDEKLIADQVARRKDNAARNAELNKDKSSKHRDSVLFGRLGGMTIIPQDNFSKLSAMSSGLLSRPTPADDSWLTYLERHVQLPEDPAIWTFVLIYEGSWLFNADRTRVHKLLTALWSNSPDTFWDPQLLPTMWRLRKMFPPELLGEILTRCLASPDEKLQQGAAEFVLAGHVVDPLDEIFASLHAGLSEQPSPSLTGRLFGAAAAWRENDSSLREGAHRELMAFIDAAGGDQAKAISDAVDGRDRLIADGLTKELLNAMAGNEEVLQQALNRRFAEGLQSLLLYPGFDEVVLDVVESVAVSVTADNPSHLRGLGMEDFVQLAIALQRNEGELRRRAMDVYEALLDAGVYGAEQAAKAATSR